jgi:hypothetical protein
MREKSSKGAESPLLGSLLELQPWQGISQGFPPPTLFLARAILAESMPSLGLFHNHNQRAMS